MNIYYDPEKFGLEVFETLEKDLSYAFDEYIIWKDKDERLYYANDSGCSCPSPFEEIGMSDLNHLSLSNIEDFQKEVEDWNTTYDNLPAQKIREVIKNIENHLNKNK